MKDTKCLPVAINKAKNNEKRFSAPSYAVLNSKTIISSYAALETNERFLL